MARPDRLRRGQRRHRHPGHRHPYPAGPLGGSLECLPYGADALCGWADTTTAAVAYFPRTAPAAAARTFAAMRSDLEH
ncbi:hypothetical protein GCM10025734_34040 [Kitasatospora paranensis]|uniref:hypothetical protein n=1 Tax=Kitasatospora paranensis TaxID=258053 RepID=UPI0031EBC452